MTPAKYCPVKLCDCRFHDPNSGPGSDQCMRCYHYVQPERDEMANEKAFRVKEVIHATKP